jgi:acetyltransferase
MLISDRMQCQGLRTQLLQRLVDIGREWGLSRIVADILARNTPMQRVCLKLGFEILGAEDPTEEMVKAVKVLG